MAKNAKQARGGKTPEVAEDTKAVKETEAGSKQDSKQDKKTKDVKDAKNAKAGKDGKGEKKPNFFVRTWKRLRGWAHDMRVELKKVHWPTRKELAKNCLVVLVCILAVGVCIWIFDALAAAIIRALVNLFQG